MRIFGKGKCEFIANFSATMVTSLPSVSLCISLSLSLSLSHRKYLTHNIGSASALPIILVFVVAFWGFLLRFSKPFDKLVVALFDIFRVFLHLHRLREFCV